jgi:hypothetical protein
MRTSILKKRNYNAPFIAQIKLDNEISLALESNPPFGPEEGYISTPKCFSNDPLKTNLS